MVRFLITCSVNLYFSTFFIQHKMSMSTTGIWDEGNDDDKLNDIFENELNNNFDDEEDDFGLGYLSVISELQVTRKDKWVHQCLT